MLSLYERRERIESIHSLPSRLTAVVGDMSEKQLNTPYGEGKWTVRQVVHHLADAHMHAFLRMKNVLTEDHPHMTKYDQVKYAVLPDTASAPIAPSLQILFGLHGRWTNFLNSLADPDWSRTGVHFRRGEMSLDDMLAHYAQHGENHLKQITDLCDAQGW